MGSQCRQGLLLLCPVNIGTGLKRCTCSRYKATAANRSFILIHFRALGSDRTPNTLGCEIAMLNSHHGQTSIVRGFPKNKRIFSLLDLVYGYSLRRDSETISNSIITLPRQYSVTICSFVLRYLITSQARARIDDSKGSRFFRISCDRFTYGDSPNIGVPLVRWRGIFKIGKKCRQSVIPGNFHFFRGQRYKQRRLLQ